MKVIIVPVRVKQVFYPTDVARLEEWSKHGYQIVTCAASGDYLWYTLVKNEPSRSV